MSMKPIDKKNILLSGFFVFFLILIMTFSIFIIEKDSDLFSKKVLLHTIVGNAHNLKEGAFVQLKGVKVGSVTNIQFLDVSKLKITFVINKKSQPFVKKDSYIQVQTEGVLGDRFLEILGGSKSQDPISQSDFLISKEQSKFDLFINKGENILSVATRVLHRLDNILSSMNENRLSNIFSNLESISKNTSQMTAYLSSKDFKDTLQYVNHMTQSLDAILEKVERGPGTAHMLIHDQEVYNDLKTLLGGAQRNKILQYFIRENIKKSTK